MNKQSVIAWALLAATVATLSLPTLARPGGNHPRAKEINSRREAQHLRIQQGLKSGALTKDEAKLLREEGRTIHDQEKAWRAANGGRLTKAQQEFLNAELNARSQQIKTEKHD